MSDADTTESLRVALRDRYTMPEWILMEEVGNATGCRCKRFADALAYNLYPSKNYHKIGFEIKASKGDLRRELKDGSKSDAIAKYCDEWYLVVPKGLCDNEDIPMTWGIMELNNDKLRIKKKAEKINKIPFDNDIISGILQSVMRTARNTYEWNERIIRDEMSKDIRNHVADGIEMAVKEMKADVESFRHLKERLGLYYFGLIDEDEFVEKFKIAESLTNESIKSRSDQLARISKDLLDESNKLLKTIKGEDKSERLV
jgi:hypothetical protein